jgi:MraZ protein
MTTFIGDYTCKVDPKGRIMLPQAFKKNMPEVARDKFVIKKDIYEKCLVLYPLDEWQRRIQTILDNTNQFNREHRMLIREFSKDTAEVELDANNRFLIPARLLKMAEVDKDVILAGQLGQIEVWSKELYEQTSINSADFGELADKILGGNLNKPSAL